MFSNCYKLKTFVKRTVAHNYVNPVISGFFFNLVKETGSFLSKQNISMKFHSILVYITLTSNFFPRIFTILELYFYASHIFSTQKKGLYKDKPRLHVY